MIELTQLNGRTFILNSDLIETLENIPETKIRLTDGNYYIVREDRREIVRRVIAYKRRLFRHDSVRQRPLEQESAPSDGGSEAEEPQS